MIVKYSRKYPYAQFLNEDIGFEYEIKEGDDPLSAINWLKELADKAHKENNPHLYQQNHPELYSSEQPPTDPIQSWIDEINSYTTLEQINKVKYLQNSSKPQIKQAYQSKLKELTQ